MSEPFKGTINVDIRDSVPDWTPFEPPKAPAGAPSVVYIVLDDVGFSAMSCYGGPIEAPDLQRVAAAGGGFERWYGSRGAEPNQGSPDLVYDNHPVDQPKLPQDGYHLTDDLTDKALEFIKDAKTVAPDKPFFLYYAPGAAHAPHHVSKEWADKFKGRFDMGYEAIREQTLARQKQLGIVPAETELPPVNPIGTPETRKVPKGQPFPPLDVTRPWDSLSAEEKRLFCRMGQGY